MKKKRKTGKKRKPETTWTASSLEDVARFFSIGFGTARDWKKGGMPGDAGVYDLAEIFRWYREREARRNKTARGKGPGHVLEVYKARREKLRFEREVGQLMRTKDHESFVLLLIAAFKTKLEHVSATLSDQLEGQTQAQWQQQLRDAFDSLLKDLAENGGRTEGTESV